MDKYLPIGTICTIQNYQKKVMIVGFFSVEYNGSVKMYDYKGCDYPEGLLSSNKVQSFNATDILEIHHMGYQDEFYESFNTNLTKQNSTENKENYTQKDVFKNIQFDENGVVIYEAVPSPTYKKNVQEVPSVTQLEESVANPFTPPQVSEDTFSTDNSKEWSIFKNIQFDENGVVISAEEYTEEELNNKE